MKKAILSIAIAIMGVTSAQAQIDCEQVGRMAKMIMETRQAGAQMDDLIKWADRHSNQTFGPLFKSVVSGAYAHPRYSTASNQKKAITMFADQHLMMCMQIMNK
jgi:hypothetical protein